MKEEDKRYQQYLPQLITMLPGQLRWALQLTRLGTAEDIGVLITIMIMYYKMEEMVL